MRSLVDVRWSFQYPHHATALKRRDHTTGVPLVALLPGDLEHHSLTPLFPEDQPAGLRLDHPVRFDRPGSDMILNSDGRLANDAGSVAG